MSKLRVSLLRIVDSRTASLIRGAVLLTFSILSLLTCVLAAPKLQGKDLDPVYIEHRFTSLETKVDQIVGDITEMKYLEWFKMLSLAGLLGEAGIRIVKKG